MSYSRLRIYHGPAEQLEMDEVPDRPHSVTVPLGDVLSALTDAVHSGRIWVDDFLNDEISISSDLYEVLLAYDHYRRPAG